MSETPPPRHGQEHAWSHRWDVLHEWFEVAFPDYVHRQDSESKGKTSAEIHFFLTCTNRALACGAGDRD